MVRFHLRLPVTKAVILTCNAVFGLYVTVTGATLCSEFPCRSPLVLRVP